MSHDNWIGTENSPTFDLLLSLADKASHNNNMAYCYVWASNKFYMQKYNKPAYKNHFDVLSAFALYQTRAWKLFRKHPIDRYKLGANSYISVCGATVKKYQDDPDGENFFKFLDAQRDIFVE